MASNSGFRVHVTRVITYSYDEHFFTEKDAAEMENTLSNTVSFRDRAQCVEYDANHRVSISQITD